MRNYECSVVSRYLELQVCEELYSIFTVPLSWWMSAVGYTSTVPVEISGRYRSTCTAAVSCSIARLYTTIVIWNSRVEHHSSNRSTRTNRWLQHTVNVCSLAATAAGREAQRQNGEDDYCTIAKSGLLALVGRAACRGLLACLSCWPRSRLGSTSSGRVVASRLAIVFTSSFKQEATN